MEEDPDSPSQERPFEPQVFGPATEIDDNQDRDNDQAHGQMPVASELGLHPPLGLSVSFLIFLFLSSLLVPRPKRDDSIS